MVKVNYYKVEGFEKVKKMKDRKGVVYGRSKKDSLFIAQQHGFEEHSDISKIREMNLTKEVSDLFSPTDLLLMRTEDKKHWDASDKAAKEVKEAGKAADKAADKEADEEADEDKTE